MRFIAEVPRDEVEQGGLLSDVAIRRDAISRFHARAVEEFTKSGRAFELVRWILNQARERNVPGVGNMTGARHLSRFRAGVKLLRSGIENHYSRLAQIRLDPFRGNHEFRVRARGERPGLGSRSSAVTGLPSPRHAGNPPSRIEVRSPSPR